MKKILILFLLTILFTIPVLGNDLIQEGSIGNIENKEIKNKDKNEFKFIPIKDWEGLEFIFLPQSKSSQEYGYQLFNKKDEQFKGIEYKKYVGKTIEVIELKKNGLWEVAFRVKETGEVLVTQAFGGTIDNIALISDIKKARKKWIGKTLWTKSTELVSYNFEKDTFNSVEIKKYRPVKVKNIVGGWYSSSPIRFILETLNGKQGYVDINLSGTNVSKTLRDNNKFEDEFLTENIREKHDFSLKVWKAIEKENVFTGMTKKQVELSWGQPKDINKTISGSNVSEQWVYQNYNYLYFENGKLTTIQN